MDKRFKIVGNGILKKYLEEDGVTEVVIPSNVTGIKDNAFKECDRLMHITIQDGVTSIGKYAFAFCTKLTEVEIPESVTIIGEKIFWKCSALKSITIRKNASSNNSKAEELKSQLEECVNGCKIDRKVEINFVDKEETLNRKHPLLLEKVFDLSNERYGKCDYKRDYGDECKREDDKKWECGRCMWETNFHKENDKAEHQYHCYKLADWYVWEYMATYSSEMYYALQHEMIKQSLKDSNRYPFFNIVSLGAGDATDLMAFDYLKQTGELTQPIRYLGLEQSKEWENVENDIEEIFNPDASNYLDVEDRARFERGIDVTKWFENNDIKGANVLCIQYLISYLYDVNDEESIKKLYSQLVEKIVKNKVKDKPMLIILSDVSWKNRGRDTFEDFAKMIEARGFKVNSKKQRLVNSRDRNDKKGTKEYEGATKLVDPENIFSPWVSDDSYHKNEEYYQSKYLDCAQMIIEVE